MALRRRYSEDESWSTGHGETGIRIVTNERYRLFCRSGRIQIKLLFGAAGSAWSLQAAALLHQGRSPCSGRALVMPHTIPNLQLYISANKLAK